MIPRLYSKTETTFDTYGICPLIDALECTVTERRNEEFELDMVYAKEGRFVAEITADRIILADPYDGAENPEPFRIVDIEYDMDGNLEIHAEHTSYQLNHIIIGRVTKIGQKPDVILHSMAENNCISSSCPFTFSGDIESSVARTVKTENALPLRTIIGGIEGSIIDTFGGELKYERYVIRVLRERGSDKGVRIAYGKNLTGLKYEIDTSNVVTGVVAYYSSGDNYVESALRTRSHTYGFSHDIAVDATSDFDSVPTVAQLNTWAANYLNTQPAEPKISVEVDFVLLWQLGWMEHLEHVNLCDTVEIIYPPLNLKMSAKVVKTVYNVLEDRYDSVTISNTKQKITDTIYVLMKKR